MRKEAKARLWYSSEPGFQVHRRQFDSFFGTEDFFVREQFTGEFVPCAVAGGDSIGFGSHGGETGTAGCVLSDVSGREYLLSCNHVIANLNRGRRKSDEVWQPGPHDGGTSSNRIGILSDFEDIVFGGTHPNYMDAAIAAVDPAVTLSRSIGGIGIVGGTDPSPKLNMTVKKFGKQTKLTAGDFVFDRMSLILKYASGDALFVEQHGIVEGGGGVFASAGDSGSLIVNGSNEAFGLLFCIASTGDVAVANPIGGILTRFGLRF